MALWGLDIFTDILSTWIGFTLFAIDYIAQMYDPHPDNPGPWFKRHFHRVLDDDVDTDNDYVECKEQIQTRNLKIILSVLCFIILIMTSAAVVEIYSIPALLGQ